MNGEPRSAAAIIQTTPAMEPYTHPFGRSFSRKRYAPQSRKTPLMREDAWLPMVSHGDP